MFEPESPSPIRRWLSFGVQQVVAPLASMIIGGIAGVFITEVFSEVGHKGFGDFFVMLLPLLVGFVLGYSLRTRFQAATQPGRWVWILPTCIWISVFIDEFVRFPGRVGEDMFYPARSDTGLGLVLFTLPAAAPIFYSIGVVIAARRAKRAVQLVPPYLSAAVDE
jgi:uncharacterized membrane protein YeaQ/YmgE (transglycosylase-associated protein family)